MLPKTLKPMKYISAPFSFLSLLAIGMAVCCQTRAAAPLTISCPPTVISNANPDQCSATNVNLGTPIVSGGCTISSITNNAPLVFPVGTNIVTWRAVDTCSSTATCNQTVIILDKQVPAISCPPDVNVNTDLGQC